MSPVGEVAGTQIDDSVDNEVGDTQNDDSADTMIGLTVVEVPPPKFPAGDIVSSQDMVYRAKEMTAGYTVAQQRWTCVELGSGSEVMLGAHVLKPINRVDGHSYIAVLMEEVDIDHPDITKLRIVGVRQGARYPLVKILKMDGEMSV